MKSSSAVRLLLSFSGFPVRAGAEQTYSTDSHACRLREGWTLQSSGKVDEKGETLSTPSFSRRTGTR